MITLTKNTKTILGRTVTQIIQTNPVPENLEEIAPEDTLGGWVESLDSIDPTSWIDENIVLFKEVHVSKYNIITSPYPETLINVFNSRPFTVLTVKSKNQFFNNVVDINNPTKELPDMTANQYKLKYFAFDTFGDPIDPCSREKIYDPVYEALKKQDKKSKKAPIVKPKQQPATNTSEYAHNENFIMRFAGTPTSKRYTWIKRIETILLILGLLTLANIAIRLFFR